MLAGVRRKKRLPMLRPETVPVPPVQLRFVLVVLAAAVAGALLGDVMGRGLQTLYEWGDYP